MNWSIVAARYGHINRIAGRLRDIDRRECAAVGHSPKRALILGLRGSSMCWTALLDGEPVAMFGVCPASVIDRAGTPWMLGTDDVRLGARLLVRAAPPVLGMVLAEFPRLSNYVSTENLASIRWLERLGFHVAREEVVIRGLAMRRFSIGPERV